VAIGLLAALQAFETERHRSLWYVYFMILVATLIYSVILFGVFGVEIRSVLDWPTVIMGSVAWVGSMTGYLAWATPVS
jgi:hypothetical protein